MTGAVYLPGRTPDSAVSHAWRVVQAVTLFLCLAAFGAGFPILLALLLGRI